MQKVVKSLLHDLFEEYDHIIVFDTETTGINHKTDEIIELAMIRLIPGSDSLKTDDEFDCFIRMSPGRALPPEIIRLTGITQQMLDEQGCTKQEAAQRLTRMLDCSRPLLAAYNAQFDLCFIYYFLSRYADASILQKVRLLDAMTIYKDRRPYPHRLCNAVDAYQLRTQNTHRAIDDAGATVELLCAMELEENDLCRYVNLFGYNPKYGISGPRIRSVTYRPQGFQPNGKLYADPTRF